MRHFPWLPAVCALLVLATVTGCGSARRRGEPLVGAFTPADAALQRGRVAFEKHCYKCHAQGEGALAFGTNHLPLPKAMIKLQVRAGMGAMPAFSKEELSDRELDELVDYMVALRQHGR